MRAVAFQRLLVLVWALILGAAPVLALDSSPAPQPRDGGAELSDEVAPVAVDGRVLFSLRGIPSYPAVRRAAAVADRIRGLARDPSFDPASLAIINDAYDSRISAGDRFVLRILDADAEREGIDRRSLATVYLVQVQQAIVSYRSARTREALASAGWRAALALVLAALALFAVRRGFRFLEGWMERRYGARVQAVTISTFELVRAERVRSAVHAVLHLVMVLSLFFVGFFSMGYVLSLFPWTRGAASQLGDWVLAPLAVLGNGLALKLPDLVFLGVMALVVRYTLRLLRLFFAALGQGEVKLKDFDPVWADPTYKIVRLAVIVFALIVAYPYIPGSDSAAFKGVSLFIGVVFSLSSSTALANVMAGYMIIYRRAFHEGDTVKIGDVFGLVTRVRLQATHVRSLWNEEVVVPNSTILGSEVVNYSALAKKDGLLLHATVGIGYETPWRQVEAMLLEAAARTPGLRPEPAPFVLQTALGDFAVTYELNVACDDPTAMRQLLNELYRNVQDVFNEHDVQIMTPAYMADPAEPKVVPRDKWFLPPARKP
jgi:small-conductance mechanosensitive channel